MKFRPLVGGGGVAARPWSVGVRAFAGMLALVAGLWGGAEARHAAHALDHHAVVLNGRIVGSAFMIDGDLALTNAHVVEGLRPGGTVTLISEARRAEATARLIAVSPRMDLALLRAPAGFLPVVSRDDAPQRAGLRVLGAGVDASTGRGIGPNMELPGEVVHPRTDLGAFGPGLVVSMPGVRPGFSGGPVLDGAGRLVGMITAIRSSGAQEPARAASGGAARRRPPDEAFVLRADAIRREALRLLRTAER